MKANKLYDLCFTNQDLAAKMSAKMYITSKFIRGKNLIVCEVSPEGVYFEERQGGHPVSTVYVNRNGVSPIRFM